MSFTIHVRNISCWGSNFHIPHGLWPLGPGTRHLYWVPLVPWQDFLMRLFSISGAVAAVASCFDRERDDLWIEGPTKGVECRPVPRTLGFANRGLCLKTWNLPGSKARRWKNYRFCGYIASQMRKHELKTGSARHWSCKPSHSNQTKQKISAVVELQCCLTAWGSRSPFQLSAWFKVVDAQPHASCSRKNFWEYAVYHSLHFVGDATIFTCNVHDPILNLSNSSFPVVWTIWANQPALSMAATQPFWIGSFMEFVYMIYRFTQLPSGNPTCKYVYNRMQSYSMYECIVWILR